jgi:hypothetical protein
MDRDEEAVLHTAYYILSQTGDFAAQAYHTIMYQWMHVLKNQGVEKKHVIASATRIENITLANPKSSLTGDHLFAPDAWEDRLLITPSPVGWGMTFLDAFSDWGKDVSVRRVVVILVGPGIAKASNSWRGGLSPSIIRSIHTRCANKPMLVVLDFDDSGLFADASVALMKGEIFLLAAGRDESRKTAAVLCDDAEAVPLAPGPDSLRYAIYSTMFHRSLFDLVVFSSLDPSLSEIADLMNVADARCRGFEAVLVSPGPVREDVRLRDFFGGPVNSNALTGILPVRPAGGFIDDINYFVREDAMAASDPRPNDFVRFRLNGSEIELKKRGRFRQIDPYEETLRLHIAYGPFLKPPLSVPLGLSSIVDAVVFQFCRDGVVPRSAPLPGQLTAEQSTISNAIECFILRENGPTSVDWDRLNDFDPYLESCDLNEWYRRIREALDSHTVVYVYERDDIVTGVARMEVEEETDSDRDSEPGSDSWIEPAPEPATGRQATFETAPQPTGEAQGERVWDPETRRESDTQEPLECDAGGHAGGGFGREGERLRHVND